MYKVFADPTPITMEQVGKASIIHEEMRSASHVGGGIITTTIITCGAKLGSATIKTVGTAIVIIAA